MINDKSQSQRLKIEIHCDLIIIFYFSFLNIEWHELIMSVSIMLICRPVQLFFILISTKPYSHVTTPSILHVFNFVHWGHCIHLFWNFWFSATVLKINYFGLCLFEIQNSITFLLNCSSSRGYGFKEVVYLEQWRRDENFLGWAFKQYELVVTIVSMINESLISFELHSMRSVINCFECTMLCKLII